MKRIHLIIVLISTLLLTGLLGSAVADDYEVTVYTFKQSPTVQPFFASAYGYAVFPTIGKGGFVIGASYGKGLVFRNEQVTGEATMAKASIGAQLGGQAFSEIIFFENKEAYDRFTSDQFEFEASASAVAITAGAQAKAGTDGATASASTNASAAEQRNVGYRRGMAVFVHIKGGLMYEASIGGQAFKFTPLNK